MSKKIYHQVAVALAIISIILAVGLLIWGERGTIFLQLSSFNCRIGRTNGKVRGGIGIDFHHS